MKNYNYNGDLEEDIKISNKKFNIKKFFSSMRSNFILHFIVVLPISILLYFTKILVNYVNNITSLFCVCLGCSIGRGIVDGFIDGREKAKNDAEIALNKIADLYEDINLNFSNRALSMARMKECVVLQKNERVIEDTNTNNIILTQEEKLVTYFYLLDPNDKVQVLRQIKDEISKDSTVYLLEEEDIKRENIEVPVEKLMTLKSKRN